MRLISWIDQRTKSGGLGQRLVWFFQVLTSLSSVDWKMLYERRQASISTLVRKTARGFGARWRVNHQIWLGFIGSQRDADSHRRTGRKQMGCKRDKNHQ